MTPAGKRRLLVVCAAVAVAAVTGWILWTRSDAYQRRSAFARGAQLVARHPAMPPAVIAAWFGAAAVYDRKAAVQALQTVPAGAAREQSVSAMARSLLSAGHTIDALAVAGEISDAGTLATLLKDLAARLVSTTEPPGGELAAEIKRLADQEREPAIGSTMLATLTSGLAALGAGQAAATVAHQVPDPGEQAATLLALSRRFNDEGNATEASAARREALAAAHRIAAPRQRLAVAMQLLVAYYEAGELPLAKSALTAATSAAAALPDAGSRVEFLPVFARALERAGDPAAAQAAVTQALAAARALPQPSDRAAAYARIVGLSRDPAQLDSIVRDIEKLPPDTASATMSAAARSFAAIGQLRKARELSQKCVSPADELAATAAILRAW
jgi:hypothetical protein